MEPDETKSNKSIVPVKYSARYRKGNGDELSTFIRSECRSDDGKFSYDAFFKLVAANDVAQDQIEKYRDQVEQGLRGSQGRARMTLRNLLESKVRASGKVVGLSGKAVPMVLQARTTSGSGKEAA